MLPFTVPIKTRQVENGKGSQATKWPMLVQTMFNVLSILRLSPVTPITGHILPSGK